MNSIGKSLLLLSKIHTPEEILAKIDEISSEKTFDIIQRIFNYDKISMAVVGKFNKKLDFKDFVK